MTDEPAAPSPLPAADPPLPERARVEPSARRRFDALPLFYLIALLVLAGTLFFLWRNPPNAEQSQQAARGVQSLQSQVRALQGQVAQMQTRTTPTTAPDVQQLQDRVTALENRPAPAAGAAPAADEGLSERVGALENRPAPDLGPLEQRIAALEQRPQVDLGPVEQRLRALEQRPQVDLGPLTSRVEQLAGQGRDQVARIDARLGTIEQRLDAVEASAKQTQAALEQVRQRTEVATKLQAASAALAAGQKVPAIPGAPPALARFQSEAPPTEASLRQSFEKYAAEAERASQPAIMDNQSFGTRLWNRAQQAVTVRQGERVLLGDPIAGVLAGARDKLDAGDLAGAVKALDGLAGPAAAAMKPWVDQARALLDARAAIASLAAAS